MNPAKPYPSIDTWKFNEHVVLERISWCAARAEYPKEIRNMKSYVRLFSISIMVLVVSCGSNNPQSVSDMIHAASVSIETSANYQAVTESLFEQIRPRVNITDETLTPEEIDSRVLKYISEKYTPVLVRNYQQLYSSLLERKLDFADCNAPVPIQDDDVLQSLCMVINEPLVEIKYLTNAYSQGWKTASIFKFMEVEGKYELVDIDIRLSGDQKAYVEGV